LPGYRVTGPGDTERASMASTWMDSERAVDFGRSKAVSFAADGVRSGR
jgi:hypothetical protein